MGVNKQIILGNVGQEPRISTFSDGGTVANFSVAYTEKGYTTKDGRQIPDSTEWFNIVAKNSLANVVQQYVHKGDKIYIEGTTKTREYVQRNIQKRITEVHAEKIDLLGRLAFQDAAAPQQQDTVAQLYGQPQQTTMQQPAAAPPKDDDLPF